MVGVTRFLGTQILAAVGSRVLDGNSPNGLYMSQIPGIYSLVSQKLAWTMLTRMCESIRDSLVFDGKVTVVGKVSGSVFPLAKQGAFGLADGK